MTGIVASYLIFSVILIVYGAMALLPPDEFALEGLGPAAIRGKSEAVEIYKVL